VGLVRPEFTPVEIATSGLYGIYPYGLMSAFEAGASDASADGWLTLGGNNSTGAAHLLTGASKLFG